MHRAESTPSLEPIVRWGLPFYTKNGKDVCYIKPDKDFIAFGFAEVVNPSHEEGGHMHPVAWTVTSLLFIWPPFDCVAFLARLAALVPPPRYPLLQYHGVLAPRILLAYLTRVEDNVRILTLLDAAGNGPCFPSGDEVRWNRRRRAPRDDR